MIGSLLRTGTAGDFHTDRRGRGSSVMEPRAAGNEQADGMEMRLG